jgi:isopenicillin N synthase-like dioxygenase
MYVKTVDYRSSQAAQEFAESLRDTGFAVLSHHPLPPALVEEVYKDWKDYFEHDAKFDDLFNPNERRQVGYFPFKAENAKGYSAKDLKEFYHYRDERNLPKGMGRNTQLLFEALLSLSQEIFQWIEAELPHDVAKALSMPLTQMMEGSDMNVLRVLHYPPITTQEEEGAVRAAAHEDINLLTLLPAATTSGLQVLDRAGKWHEVSCDYGTLVCNAGDLLQLATRGFYRSTTHRVTNPVGDAAKQSRYSLPLFLHPRNEVQLSETHTAGSYLDERFREIGVAPLTQAA